MSRSRASRFLWPTCLLAAACVDGSGPTASGRAVSLDVRPSYQVDPSLFPAEPVDRIRLVARDASASEEIGNADLEVSPTAEQWTLSLGIALGDAQSRAVVVDVELLTGDDVQWSGRLGPITVHAGTTSPVQSVDIHRGPLDNLDVIALDLVDPPSSIAVGATALLVASPTLVAGSTVVPTVYWASTSTSVATVTAEGLAATVTGVGPGITQIVAVAGSASVELDLEVIEIEPPAGTTTWVGGAVGAESDWHTASNWSPAGVPGASDDVVIPADEAVSLSADASVASLTMEGYATLDLGGFTLTVSEDLDAELASVFNGLTRMTGAGSVLSGAFGGLEIAADRVLSGYVNVTGDLTVSDGFLDVNGWLVSVAGNLQVVGPNAYLIMVDPADFVSVVGDVVFDGGDHTNLLSAGGLLVEGDFTVTDRSATGFAASGNHALYFIGSAPRSVSFAVPGPAAQRIANLFIQSTSPTTFASSARVIEDVTLYGIWEVPLSRTVDIDGTLALFPGGTLVVDGTVTAAGGCFSYGGQIQGSGTHPCPPPPDADYAWVGGDADAPRAWAHADNWQPVGVPGATDVVYIPYSTSPPLLDTDAAVGGVLVDQAGTVDLGGFTLSVAGDLAANGAVTNGLVVLDGGGTQLSGFLPDVEVRAPRAASGHVHVAGSLRVLDQLVLGPYLVDVVADFSVESSAGSVVLNDPSSYLYLGGNATFDGADHTDSFTDGLLVLLGDLTVGETWTSVAFRTAGTVAYFAGDSNQTVRFSNPAPGFQAFRDLNVVNTAGALLLASDVVVEGTFYSSGSTLGRAAGAATPVLRVHGIAQLYQTTFDGLPLLITTTGRPSDLVLSSVTFTNMPTAETQLYVAVPADGVSPLSIQSPVFDTPPEQGFYYLHVVNTSQQGALLEVHVTSPTPVDQPAEIQTGGGPVEIIWPYVP